MTEDEARAKVNELVDAAVRLYTAANDPLVMPRDVDPFRSRRDALIAEVVAGLVKHAAPMPFEEVAQQLRGFQAIVQSDTLVNVDMNRMRKNPDVPEWAVFEAGKICSQSATDLWRQHYEIAATICGGTFESGRFVPGKGEDG